MGLKEADRRLQQVIETYNMAEFFSDIEMYKSGMKFISFPKNTYIYSRPEHKKYVYFLIEGRLQVYATAEDGSQMLIRCCQEFIFIGDMELLGYQEPANMTETMTECTFLAMDISLFRDKLMQDRKFLRFLCNNLAEKITYFSKIQFHNKTSSPRKKVAVRISEQTKESPYYKENLRKVAELLEISYRHLHRILREFVECGILERSQCGYKVIKQQELEQYIDIS